MKKYSDLGAYPGVVFRDILIPYSLKNGDIAEALNMATRAPNNEMLYAIYDIISKQCIAIGDVVGAYVCCEEIARRYHYGTGLIARIVMDLAASKQPQLVKQITDNFLLHVPKRKRNENWSKKRFLMGISREFARQDNFDMANHFASKLTLIDRRKIKKELAGLEEQN